MNTAAQHSDIIILGSGFAGSLLSMICLRLGYSVTLIEKGAHPRFCIGESSTPLSNLVWEELCAEYDLPQLSPFSSYGSWTRQYPYVACGKKRGFTFLFHHEDEEPDSFLVAASPNDELADTHWFRSEFDEFLVMQASKLGVQYLDKTTVDSVLETEKGMTVHTSREGSSLPMTCRFLVDAGGAGNVMGSLLGIPRRSLSLLPGGSALFSHFRNVSPPFPSRGVAPPFPPYAAAAHHLFEGGWMWSLAFDNGLTSAGFCVRPELKEKLNCANSGLLWEQLLTRTPFIKPAFSEAVLDRPLVWMEQTGFRSAFASGARWAMLPSAAGFVDPLLSSGFSLTLLGIQRLSRILRDLHKGDSVTSLKDYEKITFAELDASELLIAALYRHFTHPPLFRALASLYFASVSFAENARRLGRGGLAGMFLLQDNLLFRSGFEECCLAALDSNIPSTENLISKIRQTTEPFDIIGVNKEWKNHWIPIDFDYFIANAGKLGVTSQEARNYLIANQLIPPVAASFISGHPAESSLLSGLIKHE